MGNLNLSTLADGAVQERFQIELERVLANLMDPNTDHKKKRKLQLTLTFQTDERRNLSSVDVDTKTTLAPAVGITTTILMDRDNDGNAVGAEYIQQRLNFDEPDPPTNVTQFSTKSGGR